MKKYLTYREDGRVLMMSEGKNDIADRLTCKQFTIDEDKVKQNWIMKIEKGKLKYEKPPHVENKEKKELIEDKKKKLSKAKTLDEVKQIQNEIIDLIK